MRLKVLGSSSNGNCYILENDKEALIIECGVSIHDLKRGVGFSFQKVHGCLVSHEHGDHAKSINDLLTIGINIYTSRGTIRSLGLDVYHHRLKTIKAGEVVTIGSFKVLPFKIEHDVPEPLGFIINHPDCGNVLFITDSAYVTDTFKNIHNVIIEANYSKQIVEERKINGYLPDFRVIRIMKSHMSLETCKLTLLANDLSKVQNIVLIHLSDGNSNAAQFKAEIEACTGKRVHIADAGVVIENFNKRPF